MTEKVKRKTEFMQHTWKPSPINLASIEGLENPGSYVQGEHCMTVQPGC